MEENRNEEIKSVPLEPMYDDILADEEINVSNNIDMQYTEELDFSNLQEELKKQEYKDIQLDNIATEKLYNDNNSLDEVLVQKIEPQISNVEYKEHPSLKISLKNNYEEEQTELKKEDIKLDIKGNKSLFKVLFIGFIILLAVLFLPSLAISLM